MRPEERATEPIAVAHSLGRLSFCASAIKVLYGSYLGKYFALHFS